MVAFSPVGWPGEEETAPIVYVAFGSIVRPSKDVGTGLVTSQPSSKK